jgi:hypothetical protein
MHKNPVWLVFLGALLLTTIWFSVDSCWQVIKYMRLDRAVPITSVDWDIDEIHESRFLLTASYSYSYQNQEYTGKSSLSSPVFPNPWAAAHAIEDIEKHKWYAYFDQRIPSKSTLNKNFPYKDTASAFALLCLFLYFLGLGYYVGNKC